METVDNYKGIKVSKGNRDAFTMSEGTKKNAGRRFKNNLDSIVFNVNSAEFSFSISKGADYEDYKSLTREEIDFRIRQTLPRL